MSKERDEIRRGELSAQEAPGGGHEVFSDDDPFGMPAGYVEPGADPQEAMAQMHVNAAIHDKEQARPAPRRELPIPRGVSSQAGLASINGGRNYPAGAPRPGEPGSRTNPIVVDHAEQARRRREAPQGSREKPVVVDRAEQAARRASKAATSEHAAEAALGGAEALVGGVEAGGAEPTVGKAAVSGFVGGATGQLQARTDVDRRREKMTNWAERIDNQGQEVDGLER